VKEFILYLSHFTFRRALNLLLCGVGYFFSRSFRYPILLGKPISVSIEPTTRCNLNCPDCPTGIGKLGRKIGDMPLNRFIQIIDEISPTAFTVLLHFQGEPLMNFNIFDMIGYASSKRMISEMATNAMLIDEEVSMKIINSGLKKIVITIDSPIEKEFGTYRRGGNLSRIIEGIDFIQKTKLDKNARYPLVILELLALKDNVNHIKEFVEFGKKLKVDGIRVKTAHLLNPDDAENKVPLGTKYSRYEITNDGNIALKGKVNSSCSAPWFKLSVTHDGWVVPCCFDKSATYIMGTIISQSIHEIWFSHHYNNFRKRLIRNRNVLPVCSSCPQGRTSLDFKAG